jgi:hypothetical protein
LGTACCITVSAVNVYALTGKVRIWPISRVYATTQSFFRNGHFWPIFRTRLAQIRTFVHAQKLREELLLLKIEGFYKTYLK